MESAWLSSFLRSNGVTPPSIEAQAASTVFASTSVMVVGISAGLLLASLWQVQRAARLANVAGFIIGAVPPLILAPIVLILTGPSRISVWSVMLAYNFIAGFAVGQRTAIALPPVSESIWRRWARGGPQVAIAVRLPWMLWFGGGSIRAVAGYSYGVWLMMEYLAIPGGIGRIMRLAVSYNNFDLLAVLLAIALAVGVAQDQLLRSGLKAAASAASWVGTHLRGRRRAFS